MPENNKEKVGVIGAGMSGIIAARLLEAADIPYTVFEKSHELHGGPPGLCEAFHTMNLPWYKHWGPFLPEVENFLKEKHPKLFSGSETPQFFPSRREIFNEFIPKLFPKNGDILFNAEITDIEPNEHGYTLVSKDGNLETVSKVAFAMGRLPNPQISEFDKFIHSFFISGLSVNTFNKKLPRDKEAKLLVIGAGNSAFDVIMSALNSGFKGQFILINPDGRTVREYKAGSFKIDEDKILDQVREAAHDLKSLSKIFADAVSDEPKGLGRVGSFHVHKILEGEIANHQPDTEGYKNILYMSRRFGSMSTSLISNEQASLLNDLVEFGRLFQLRGRIDPNDCQETDDLKAQVTFEKTQIPNALDFFPDAMSNPKEFNIPFFTDDNVITVDAVAHASPFQDNLSRVKKEDMPILLRNLLDKGIMSISAEGYLVSNDPNIDIIGPLDHRYPFGSVSFSREGAERFVENIVQPSI